LQRTTVNNKRRFILIRDKYMNNLLVGFYTAIGKLKEGYP
jgi:hypothetical protein